MLVVGITVTVVVGVNAYRGQLMGMEGIVWYLSAGDSVR